MRLPRITTLAASLTILAAAGLAGCDYSEDSRGVARGPDGSLAQAPQQPGEQRIDPRAPGEQRSDMGARPDAEPGTGTQPGTDAARGVAPDPAQQAADASTSKAKDAMITTAINAELARDSRLSALRIDVDTNDGRVELHGTAPDADSRERATQLASSVDGVKSVDNQLTVQR